MAKKLRFSRWKRLPTVYRSGEHKLPDPAGEPERLSVYLPGEVLDQAEAQAARLGFANAQEYCTELLSHAIEDERVRTQMEEVEARRGTLEGFRAVEGDEVFLADLKHASTPEVHYEPATTPAPRAITSDHGSMPLPVQVTFQDSAPLPLGEAAWTVLGHSGQAGGVSGPDAMGFLPTLRRGEPPDPAATGDLASAVRRLESDLDGRPLIDRRLAFALHRLAYESQVLLTDAWPGAFDARAVDAIRVVQEAVERALSGEDIRYFQDAASAVVPAVASEPNP